MNRIEAEDLLGHVCALVGLGEEPLNDYLLNQKVEVAIPPSLQELPISLWVLYKELTKFCMEVVQENNL